MYNTTMKLYKKVILLIGITTITIPTIVIGSSFVGSLIEGKTPSEAIRILAEQIDLIIPRIEKIEVKQEKQEEVIELGNQKVDLLESINESQNIEQQAQINALQQTLEERIVKEMEEERLKEETELERLRLKAIADEEHRILNEELSKVDKKCNEYQNLFNDTTFGARHDYKVLQDIKDYYAFRKGEMNSYSYTTSTTIYFLIEGQLNTLEENLPRLEVLKKECEDLTEAYNVLIK